MADHRYPRRLSAEAAARIQATGDLTHVTNESCWHRDEQGRGILHLLVTPPPAGPSASLLSLSPAAAGAGAVAVSPVFDAAARATAVRTAITTWGVSPCVVDKEWQSPYTAALAAGNVDAAVAMLERAPLVFPLHVLTHRLATLESQLSEAKRMDVLSDDGSLTALSLTLGTASRLCGFNLAGELISERDGTGAPSLASLHKLIAHILQYRGTDAVGTDLEGVFVGRIHVVLALRVLALVHVYVGLPRDDVLAAPATTLTRTRALEHLQRDLQTLWIYRFGCDIATRTVILRSRLMPALTAGVCKAVSYLQTMRDTALAHVDSDRAGGSSMTTTPWLTLYAGWFGHAVYVTIRLVGDATWHIAVCNCGQGSEVHDTQAAPGDRTLVLPFFVASVTSPAVWVPAGRAQGYAYIHTVLTAVHAAGNTGRTQVEMQSAVYDRSMTFGIPPGGETIVARLTCGDNIAFCGDGTAPLTVADALAAGWTYTLRQPFSHCVVYNHNVARAWCAAASSLLDRELASLVRMFGHNPSVKIGLPAALTVSAARTWDAVTTSTVRSSDPCSAEATLSKLCVRYAQVFGTMKLPLQSLDTSTAVSFIQLTLTRVRTSISTAAGAGATAAHTGPVRTPITEAELTSTEGPCVIVGAPGAGKTTLFKRWAHIAATTRSPWNPDAPPKPEGWFTDVDTVIFLPLNVFLSSDEATDALLEEAARDSELSQAELRVALYVARECLKSSEAHNTETLLQLREYLFDKRTRGRVLWLLDGFDEVSQAVRTVDPAAGAGPILASEEARLSMPPSYSISSQVLGMFTSRMARVIISTRTAAAQHLVEDDYVEVGGLDPRVIRERIATALGFASVDEARGVALTPVPSIGSEESIVGSLSTESVVSTVAPRTLTQKQCLYHKLTSSSAMATQVSRPLGLALICSLLTRDHDDVPVATSTSLFSATEQLLSRLLQQLEDANASTTRTPVGFTGPIKSKVSRASKLWAAVCEHLLPTAFDAFEQQSAAFQFVAATPLAAYHHTLLRQLSVLEEVSDGHWAFAHLQLLEWFAARHFTTNVLSTWTLEALATWVSARRGFPRYTAIFRFIGGLCKCELAAKWVAAWSVSDWRDPPLDLIEGLCESANDALPESVVSAVNTVLATGVLGDVTSCASRAFWQVAVRVVPTCLAQLESTARSTYEPRARRERAVRILGLSAADHPEAVPVLVALLYDDGAPRSLRVHASGALLNCGDDVAGPAVALLIETAMLDTGDPLQSTAAAYLAAHGKLSDLVAARRKLAAQLVESLGELHLDSLHSVHLLALVLREQGHLAEAERMHRQVLEACNRVVGDSHPHTLDNMHNLANVLHEQGRLTDAERMYREVLDARARVLGDSHPDTLTSMSDLANVLQYQGHLTEAERMHRQALEAYSRMFGDSHSDTMRCMVNVALVLQNQGHLTEAERMHRQALEAYTRVLGDSHPDTLTSMSDLANVLQYRGHLAEAERMHRQVLEGYTRALGDSHPNTLTSMNNLANVLREQGHLAEAVRMYRQVLDIRTRVLGDSHPSTLNSMNDLAMVLREQGHLAEAERIHRRAWEVHSRVLGDSHPDTLGSMIYLAVVLHEQSHVAEAERMHRQLLGAYSRIFGDSHPDTMRCMVFVALGLQNHGRLAEAERMLRQVLEIRTRVLGDSHPDTLDSMNNLAAVLQQQGHLAEAERMLRQVVEARTRVFGDSHPDTLDSMNNLAAVLQQQAHLAEAERMHRQVLEARTRVLGDSHPSTLRSMNNLAIVLRVQGHLTEAERMYRQVLEARTRVLGDSHPDTLRSMNILALVLHQQGHLAEAERMHRQALEACTRVLGDSHPDTQQSITNLNAVLLAQGRAAETDSPDARTSAAEAAATSVPRS